jgi:hypothetical protein
MALESVRVRREIMHVLPIVVAPEKEMEFSKQL